ncbi:MAG: hypothetical protein C0475_08270 [Planctomyces sp.]|nr:hypothetical protein [Planctomyces sp.]
MKQFRALAAGAGAYRGLIAATIGLAALAGANLGAGILGAAAILEQILPRGPERATRTLGDLARDLDGRLGGLVPDGLISALPTEPFAAVVALMAALGALTVWGTVVNYAHAHAAMTVVARFARDLRQRVHAHAVRLSVSDVGRLGATNLGVHVVNDAGQVAAGLGALLNKTLIQVSKAAGALAMALVLDYRVTLAALIVAPLLYQVMRKTGTRVRRATRRGLEASAEMYRATREVAEQLRMVKCCGAEGRETAAFAGLSAGALEQELRVRRARALGPPVVELVALLTLGVLMVVTSKAIIDGSADLGGVLLTLASLGIAASCLKPLTGLAHELQAAEASAARIAGVLGMPVEPGHEAGLPELARHSRSIELRGVWYTYPGASGPALRGASLRISAGQTVAVVGPNGSGKTTLLSLIPRLIDPDERAGAEAGGGGGGGGGAVLIDGVDVRGVAVGSLRAQIAVVTQETMLFRGTVRSNLAYGAPGATDEEIERAARQARAHEFIAARPGGYAAAVGEGGAGFSGGQRQRMAIARAVLRRPAILLLDEATSMIDADSERHISDALDEFAAGRTCLIVAHRLSTVVHADTIVVMEAGRVVDQGAHAELLARCPTYRLIAENQLVRQEASGSGAAGLGAAAGA